jgi:hypothetical protein
VSFGWDEEEDVPEEEEVGGPDSGDDHKEAGADDTVVADAKDT